MSQRFQLLLSLALGTVALCLAALINGGPVMYPDTLNYLADGHGLIRLTTPDNTRPIFYGLAIELLHWERSAWPVILAQALIVAHLTYLTARTTLGAITPARLLAILVLLALLTPVSWYIAHLLPDLFAGVLGLSAYLLVFQRDRMNLAETLYVFLLAVAAICFHLTDIVTGAALCAGAWFIWLIWRIGRPWLPSIAYLLAVAALLTSSFALYHRLSFAPKSPPHFMARLIADGPGRDYLEKTCPEQHYFVCADLDRLPHTENGILWRYMSQLGDDNGRRFRSDSGAIVQGTLRMFPAQVAGHMLLNTLRQLVTFGSGTEMDPYAWDHFTQPAFMVHDVQGTLQQRDLLDPILAPLNLLHAIIAAASALVCVAFFIRSRDTAIRALIATAALTLLANAFAAGALGGVFGRYQGRVIWLVPAIALIALLSPRRHRHLAPRPGAAAPADPQPGA